MDDNPLRYVFRTPPSISLDLAPKRTDKSNYTPNSRTSAETAPDSTVTKITRESQAVRADVIMRDMDDMRKGLLEIQAEGRQNQGRLEMSAVMKERDRQADERMRMMSDLMQRRENDANSRMIDLMTTMTDLTLGVRAMAAQTAAAQTKTTPAAPVTSHSSDLPSTSAAPHPTQATYRKVAQSNIEQPKPLKLLPLAT